MYPINQSLLDFVDADVKNIVIFSDSDRFMLYNENIDNGIIIPYQDSEVDKDLVDSFLHSIDLVVWKDLKQSMKAISNSGMLTWIKDITSNLWDIDIMQHLYDENNPIKVEWMDSLSIIRSTLEKYKYLLSVLAPEQISLYKGIEAPLIKVLLEMELEWICVDKKVLQMMGENVDTSLIKLGGALSVKLWSASLNLNSPKQLSDLFFNVMKIPVKDKWRTKTGISTASHVIEEISKENPQVRDLLEYRELMKIRWTYIEPIIKKVHDGKIHATFNQTWTVTGRLSSNNPNLQNISSSGKYDIKSAFQAKNWYSFIDLDFSQIEIRVLASMAEEDVLMNAYNQGRDIHQETADRLWITRQQAKWVNFWIIYWMSSYWLAETLHVSEQDAKLFIKKYFEAFPKVLKFIKDTKESLVTLWYVETLFGRRRHFPTYPWSEFAEKNRIERQAVNARVQGTAADIMKLALIEVMDGIHRYDAKIVVTVHDEIIIEVKDEYIDNVKEIARDKMESAGKWKIKMPLIVEINQSKKWKKK